MGLPRFRDGSLFYACLGCAVTTFYFVVFYDTSTPTSVVHVEYAEESRRRVYEYQEVCKEWQLALDRENTTNNHTTLSQDVLLDSWDDSVEFGTHFYCDNSYKERQLSQRGPYYVIYNFVKAEKAFGCFDSITLSAPGDYRFLDNVIPLVDRWDGPISIALYAPGDDLFTTISAIAYLRNCETDLVRKLVSFHVIFEQEHTPKQNGTTILNSYEDVYDCSLPPPWQTGKDEDMYKTKNKLLYPINVARNVAKLAAQTYFVFPSDIELYPTRNFTSLFFTFVKENLELFEEGKRNVFVLPIFEILQNEAVPENKTRLLDMLKAKTAMLFHQRVCAVCHRVIEGEKWAKTEETQGLGVFSIGKRTGKYMVWEPFFVCTQKEPLWDERMTWEGQNNKMVQALTMCVMNYDFVVLDNAFLIHKPGVKKKKVQMQKFNTVVQQSTKLIKRIAVELQELHGYNTNCSTTYNQALLKRMAKLEPKPAYTMCVMNYNFYVLDNAFLVHKPGVKKYKKQVLKFNHLVQKTNNLMKRVAIELQEIHGYSSDCTVIYDTKKR